MDQIPPSFIVGLSWALMFLSLAAVSALTLWLSGRIQKSRLSRSKVILVSLIQMACGSLVFAGLRLTPIPTSLDFAAGFGVALFAALPAIMLIFKLGFSQALRTWWLSALFQIVLLPLCFTVLLGATSYYIYTLYPNVVPPGG